MGCLSAGLETRSARPGCSTPYIVRGLDEFAGIGHEMTEKCHTFVNSKTPLCAHQSASRPRPMARQTAGAPKGRGTNQTPLGPWLIQPRSTGQRCDDAGRGGFGRRVQLGPAEAEPPRRPRTSTALRADWRLAERHGDVAGRVHPRMSSAAPLAPCLQHDRADALSSRSGSRRIPSHPCSASSGSRAGTDTTGRVRRVPQVSGTARSERAAAARRPPREAPAPP
jgi:hypothetical protein